MYTIKFVDNYYKIDLTKTIDSKMNGLQINCPKTVAWFFFLFVSFLIGKLWIKIATAFKLAAWKYLPFINDKIWNKSKKNKIKKIK